MRSPVSASSRGRRLRAGARVVLASVAVLTAAGAQTPPDTRVRIAPVPADRWTDEQRAIAAQFSAIGMPNAIATYLNHPALARAVLPDLRYVTNDSTLPPRHRALLTLRTAWLTRSGYLWAHLAPIARASGMTGDEIRRIAAGPDASGWDAFDATLLRAADELHVDSFISDPTWQALAARYDTNQLIDTIDAGANITLHAGALNSAGVQLEADVRDRLPSGIPYAVAARRTNIRLIGKGARIPPVESTGRGGRGGGANVFRTFVRHPPADRARGAVNTHVNSATANTLTPRHRELLLMRIGVLCRSEYEFAAHARVGKGLGMTDADIARIVAGPDDNGGDSLENTLLRATDELFEDDVLSPRTWTALTAALNTMQVLDVLISVGGYRSGSMLINSAGVQLDANMEDFRFPPALR